MCIHWPALRHKHCPALQCCTSLLCPAAPSPDTEACCFGSHGRGTGPHWETLPSPCWLLLYWKPWWSREPGPGGPPPCPRHAHHRTISSKWKETILKGWLISSHWTVAKVTKSQFHPLRWWFLGSVEVSLTRLDMENTCPVVWYESMFVLVHHFRPLVFRKYTWVEEKPP